MTNQRQTRPVAPRPPGLPPRLRRPVPRLPAPVPPRHRCSAAIRRRCRGGSLSTGGMSMKRRITASIHHRVMLLKKLSDKETDVLNTNNCKTVILPPKRCYNSPWRTAGAAAGGRLSCWPVRSAPSRRSTAGGGLTGRVASGPSENMQNGPIDSIVLIMCKRHTVTPTGNFYMK